MKVTVCINDVKVVVPCGNGSILIRELAQMALLRFQKSTSSVFHTKNADQSNASCTSNSSKTAEQQHQSDQLYNLSIQRKVTHSDTECHLQQIDNKNVSWKLNIDDNEYEVDSLTLARDGGILDWDDRVVDVLDDRELLIVNFRKKLPNTPTVSSDTELHHSIYCQQTDVQEGLNSKNDHSTSDTNQLNKLVQSHFLSNDNNLTDSCVKNTLSCQTLSASLNSSSALTSSSSSSSLPSYFQTVTSTLGKIICDTGVTYIQSHPILISSSQQLHQKSSNELISTESRELQQPPPPPQRYSNHRHISPSSLSENICINNICDCSLIKQGVIHNKHITGTNKVESGINKTNQYPTKLLTDYSQYNKHPVTTFIGGLEYELFSSRTPPVFRPPSFTSTETTTATSIMTKRQTSVCTASPTIHRASRPAPPPPPPPPPHSSSSSTLPASLSLPPLAQPSVVDSKRTTLHHSIPNNTTITSINRPLITPNTQMNLSKTKMITDINDQDENKTTGVSSLMKKRIFDVDESKYNRPDHSQDAPQENITYNNCAPNVSCPPDSYLPQSMTDQYEFGDGILQSKSTLDLPINIHHYHTTNTPLAFTTHTLSTHILPSSLLSSLDDYLLSNSLSSSLNTTDISIISNMNNNSLLMDTSFLSTVPEEDADMSELTSSNKTTPKQSPCKQVQLMKQLIHNNDAYSKSDYINDNEGIHSSPESSSPITVRRNLDGIHNHEADSFNCSSCQKCSDTNTEANSSSSPSKLSKDYSTSIQNIPDVHYHTRINRKQKRYRNSRAPAPPPPVTSSTASIEITPSRYQTKLPPPPPPPRSSRNDDTPYSSESDIDEQNYKNLYTFNRIHKVSDSSSSPNSINVEEMHRSPKSKSSVNRINTREYSQRGEDKRAFEQKFTSVTTCMSPSSSSSLSSGYKADTNHQHSNLTTLTSSCGQAVNTSLICPHCCEIQREKSNQLELSNMPTRKPTPPKRSPKTALTSSNTSSKPDECQNDQYRMNSIRTHNGTIDDGSNNDTGSQTIDRYKGDDRNNEQFNVSSYNTTTTTTTMTTAVVNTNDHHSSQECNHIEQQKFNIHKKHKTYSSAHNMNSIEGEEIGPIHTIDDYCTCKTTHHTDADAEVIHMTELLSKRRESEARRHLLLAEMEAGLERDDRLRIAANAMALAAVNSITSSVTKNSTNCIHCDHQSHQQYYDNSCSIQYTSSQHHLHSIDHRISENEIMPPITCCCTPECIKEKDILISLQKYSTGLGFSLTTKLMKPIKGNKSTNSNDNLFAVCVKNILPNGAAIKDGQLHVDDRLIQIDHLDVMSKTQAQIVSILRIKPVGSIVNLLVRRQVHMCQLNFHDYPRCSWLNHPSSSCSTAAASTTTAIPSSICPYPDVMNTEVNQSPRMIGYYDSSPRKPPWLDCQTDKVTRKCSSPPLPITSSYYDGFSHLERVYHPNYPPYPDVILLRLYIPLIPVNEENIECNKNFSINLNNTINNNTVSGTGLRQMRLGVSVRESNSSRASKLNELSQNTIKMKLNIKSDNEDKVNSTATSSSSSSSSWTDLCIADSIYGGVIVKCVIEGGAAHKDGRLQIGDELLEVNGVILVNANNPLSLLRSVLRKLTCTTTQVNNQDNRNTVTPTSISVTGTMTTTTTTTLMTNDPNDNNQISQLILNKVDSVETIESIQPKIVDLLIARLTRHRRSASGHTLASNSEFGSQASTTSTILTTTSHTLSSNNNKLSLNSPIVSREQQQQQQQQEHKTHHRHDHHHHHQHQHHNKSIYTDPFTSSTVVSKQDDYSRYTKVTNNQSIDLQTNIMSENGNHTINNNNNSNTTCRIKAEIHSVKVEQQDNIDEDNSIIIATGNDNHNRKGNGSDSGHCEYTTNIIKSPSK